MARVTKTLALIFALSMPALATCGVGYSFNTKITIGKPATTQTNFPLAIWGVYQFLATTANGGQIQNVANNSIGVSGPADLQFCPDNTTTGTPLKYEVGTYDATTGKIVAHVLIASLSSSSNTTIYMYWGKASQLTTLQDLSLWSDASYTGVYHLNGVTGTGLKDSMALHDATNSGAATDSTGQFGSAVNVSAGYVDTQSPHNATSITLNAWVRLTSAGSNCYSFIDNIDAGPRGYSFDLNGGCTGTRKAYVTIANGGFQFLRSGTPIALNKWTKMTLTYTGTGTGNVHIYQDGGEFAYTDASGSQSIGTSTVNAKIGGVLVAGNNTPGSIDEVRFANVVRSFDWEVAEFANQASPGGFYKLDPAGNYPQILQSATCSSSGTTTCTFLAPVSAGSVLIVSAGCDASTTCPNLPTDTLGNTYALLKGSSNAFGPNAQGIYSTLSASGGSDTVSMVVGASNAITILEVANTANVVDGSSGSFSESTTPVTLPSVTVNNPLSLMICGLNSSSVPVSTSLPAYFLVGKPSAGALGTAAGTVGTGSQTCSFNLGTPVHESENLVVFQPTLTVNSQQPVLNIITQIQPLPAFAESK